MGKASVDKGFFEAHMHSKRFVLYLRVGEISLHMPMEDPWVQRHVRDNRMISIWVVDHLEDRQHERHSVARALSTRIPSGVCGVRLLQNPEHDCI